MPTLSPPRIATEGSPALRISTRQRRRTGLLAGSLLTLLVCTALFVSAYLKAGHQIPVLEVARPVPLGAVVTSSDLGVVRISASGHLVAVPVADASEVLGRRASVPLVPGQLIATSDVSSGSPIPAGEAIVGVALKGSQLPAEGVVPGEPVDVVLTGVPGSPMSSAGTVVAGGAVLGAGPAGSPGAGLTGSPTGAVLASDVTVTAVVVPGTSQSDVTDVSLLVPHDVAAFIADASAAGQVALVNVPAR